jgi:hypothetical protein
MSSQFPTYNNRDTLGNVKIDVILYVHVSIDERDINTDFLLVLLRDMLNAYPQLKVILMSGMLKCLK